MKAFFLAVHRYGNLETEAGLALTLEKNFTQKVEAIKLLKESLKMTNNRENMEFVHENGFPN